MRSIAIVALAACQQEAPLPTAPSSPTEPSYALAAHTIVASLNSGDDASIAQYLDAGNIRIETTCPVCSDPQGVGIEPTPSVEVLSRPEFIALIHRAGQRLERGPYEFRIAAKLACDDACCTAPTGPLAPNQYYVADVCFRPGAMLASIAYLDAAE